MTATRTVDLEATGKQIRILEAAGADIIRIAVDSKEDVEALKKLRQNSDALFSVDLQENYRPQKKHVPYNPVDEETEVLS